MILRRLPDPAKINIGVPSYIDHCLFLENLSDGYSYPEHFTGLGLIALLEGEAVLLINGDSVTIDPNAFVIVNKGSRLAIKSGSKGGILTLLYFNTLLSNVITSSILSDHEVNFKKGNDRYDYSLVEHIHYKNATLGTHLRLLIDLGVSCASFHALKADMLIRNILDNIISENYSAIQFSSNLKVVKRSTKIALYKRLSIAKQWIDRNYNTPINVEQMADVAMLNSYHFLRLFKNAFGSTPHQYLIEVRLGKARELLKETEQSISGICNSIGFDSLSSFSTLFKKRHQLSPGQFRKSHR